jgi:hypothetical protein
VILRDVVGQLVRRRAEGDDDREVVQQLQGRRGAVALVGVTAAEPASVVSLLVGVRRRHGGRF